MKNLLTFFLAFLVAALKSQEHKTEFGAEGGPGIAFLRSNSVSGVSREPAPAFMAGMFFQYNFTENLSLRSGLAFERKSTRSVGELTDAAGRRVGDFTRTMRFDYLGMPLLLRFSTGKKSRFFVNAGPYAAYLVQASAELQHTFLRGRHLDRGQEAYYRHFDFGLCGGIGLSVPFKSFNLSAELRNNLGLYNINAVPVYYNSFSKHNVTLLILGFTYRFS